MLVFPANIRRAFENIEEGKLLDLTDIEYWILPNLVSLDRKAGYF